MITILAFGTLCMGTHTVPCLVRLIVYLWGLFTMMVYDLIDLIFSVLTVYVDVITSNR